MNKFFLTYCLFFFNSLFSQDTSQVFFDSDWKRTTEAEQVYFRKLYKSENKIWIVKDFYSSNGQLQMSGQYLNKKLTKRHGTFLYYYENGQIEYEKSFEKNIKTGKSTGYLVNGKKDYEGSYSSDKKHGDWFWYHKNGQLASKETYYYGTLRNIEQWDSLGVEELKPAVSIEPQFPGGNDSLSQFILNNLIYPVEASLKGQQGVVYVKFVVNKDGSLSDYVIRKGSYELLNQAALFVVKKMPKWIPGRYHNRNARFNFTLPIKFALR